MCGGGSSGHKNQERKTKVHDGLRERDQGGGGGVGRRPLSPNTFGFTFPFLTFLLSFLFLPFCVSHCCCLLLALPSNRIECRGVGPGLRLHDVAMQGDSRDIEAGGDVSSQAKITVNAGY